MADPKTDTEEAREAAAMGEKPDLGHTQDALKKALEGSDMGSDTRAGSLRGGSASGVVVGSVVMETRGAVWWRP